MKKVLVVLGPTATGKTDLALYLAKKYNGELISCDSRQIYIGLDIGTGKFPGKDVRVEKHVGNWEMDGVKVWMLDVVDPQKRYTVFNYVKDAEKVLEDIFKRKKLPIIVGGTGFYLKAILEGLSNLSIPTDKKLRHKLEKLSVLELQDELKRISPERFELLNNSDIQNPRRLVRIIELLEGGKFSILSEQKEKFQLDVLKIGLITRREIIGKRIRDRILKRLDEGMIEEVESLLKNGLSRNRMKELGLEYSIISDYLTGVLKSREELINILKIKIGQYSKRQVTWFKKEKDVKWFDITEKDYISKVEKKVSYWYNLADAIKIL